jgi:hypothetical protein
MASSISWELLMVPILAPISLCCHVYASLASFSAELASEQHFFVVFLVVLGGLNSGLCTC